MQRKLLFFILSTSFLFLQCKNEKNNTSTTSAATPSVSTTPKGFYKHFKGSIDSFPITMDLVKEYSRKDENPISFRGHYYYDKYQQAIPLYGEIDSLGNLVLHETNWADEDINFTGKLDASGSFSGTWRNISAKKDRIFTLKETYENGALAFDFQMFEDSLKLWKNKANSPMAHFDMQVLLPSKNMAHPEAIGTEGGGTAFLKEKIFSGINNDTIEKSYTNLSLENLHNAKRDTFFHTYLETLKDEKPDASSEGPFTFNHAESSSMSVLFNEKGLLSLGYGSYSYSGGAHGNHATNLATYDLAQKKVLKLNDIFLPKFEKTLNAALTNAVRRQFNMKKNEPLSNRLFDNTIQATNNFCITKKGILFLYNPYEIAAYALGEIELFLPFEEVKAVVNPRFL